MTRDGKTVWEFAHAMSHPRDGVYRAYRYPPDYPGLRYLDLSPRRTAYHDALADSPLARSMFDVYAADGYLVYVKEQCGQSDIAHLFFLHVDPERTDDLPEERRQVGFDNLDFDFFLRGALFDGKCAARIPLPDYPIAPIAAIRTGQFGPGGELWSAEFSVRDAAKPTRP